MTGVLVSVIIPTYNRKEYVQVAIESVLKQTYKEYEIIVVDDGSTDGTEQVLREKYSRHIRYYWQENQGESAARNLGITLANGEYIACLDSDDFWHPDKLMSQVKIFKKHNKGNIAAVYSSVWVVDSQGRKIKSKPLGRTWKLDKNIWLRSLFSGPKIFSPPGNMMIKSSCLREIGGFDPHIHFGEDWDLVIRLRSRWNLAYVDKPLLYYRIHNLNQQYDIASISVERIGTILADHLNVIQKNAQALGWEHAAFVVKAVAKEYEQAAYRCFSIEKWAEGVKYLVEAKLINQKQLTSHQLSSNIGYWTAIRSISLGYSYQQAENYLTMTIIPAMNLHWDPILGPLPRKNISGWYYHNLVYHSGSKYLDQLGRLCRKSIHYEPRLFFNIRSLYLIVWGFLRYGY